MVVDLDRKDIVSLLKGVEPSYEIMENIPKDLGSYTGGFVDRWNWSFWDDVDYTDEELYAIYKMCKDSWKR